MDRDGNRFFYRRYILMALVLCLCFLAASLFFLYYMMQQNNEESMEYVQDDALQKKLTIVKQIQGDLQTLEGISVCIGDLNIENDEEMSNILQEINDGNAFIRMGMADLEGNVVLYDIGGQHNPLINLSDKGFFQQARKGTSSISVTLQDPFKKGEYVNYYAVPIRDDKKEIIKILCAVNSSTTLSKIINSPIFKGSGFSNILDREGNFVIRAVGSKADKIDARSIDQVTLFTPTEERQVKEALKKEEELHFTYEVNGVDQLSVVVPLGVNGWSISGTIPKDVIKQRYNQTAIGVAVIILAALCIFLLLLYLQQRLMRRNEKALMKLAYVDPLTGCSNFSRFLMEAPAFTEAKDTYAVWYCDLKNFKYFNDAFGYSAGDEVLKALARKFGEYQGEHFLFCRISADNFAGIYVYKDRNELIEWFSDLANSTEAEKLGALKNEFVHLSMGFYCPELEAEQLSINDMVNRANMAQKAGKNQPGSRYTFFTEEIRLQVLKEREIEATGKAGIERGEFALYLQPKINIQQGNTIAGAEALARWRHPEKGLIGPGDFIPVFEKTGLIVDLDRYMLEEACKWLKAYLEDGNPRVNIAVNVSRLGLLQADFLNYYSRIKEEYQIPDHILELEFTESMVAGDDEMFYAVVRDLQQRGFICSLDDFGAGYSSLNTLKNLPVDVLKLDILFFRRSLDVEREQIVISNIINMAKDLKIKTIAEGVESLDTVDFLRKAGCDVVQGYVFERPVPLEAFDRLVREHRNKFFAPHESV